MITKKDIIALADFIKAKNGNDYGKNAQFFTANAIYALADFLGQNNPNFNRDRFLNYVAGMCGPNGGRVK